MSDKEVMIALQDRFTADPEESGWLTRPELTRLIRLQMDENTQLQAVVNEVNKIASTIKPWAIDPPGHDDAVEEVKAIAAKAAEEKG